MNKLGDVSRDLLYQVSENTEAIMKIDKFCPEPKEDVRGNIGDASRQQRPAVKALRQLGEVQNSLVLWTAWLLSLLTGV